MSVIKPRFLALYSICILLLLISLGYAGFRFLKLSSDISPSILITCFEGNEEQYAFNVNCMHASVSTLLESMSAKDLLAYVIATSSPHTLVMNCHPIGHIIGEENLKKEGDLESALATCSNACLQGCIHGVIGAEVLKELGTVYTAEDIAHADIQKIDQIGSTYCERSQSLCHGVGHIIYLANENFQKSLQDCDTIATSTRREDCYRGVFMEGVGNGSSLFAAATSSAPATNDYQYPCDTVGAQYQHACFLHLPEFQRVILEKNGIYTNKKNLEVATQTCETLPKLPRAYCFEGIGFQVKRFGIQDQEIPTFCDEFATIDDRDACTLGIVLPYTYFYSKQTAVNYCADITEVSRRNLCYRAYFQALGKSPLNTNQTVCASDLTHTCSQQFVEYQSIKANLPNYSFGLFGKNP